MHFDSEPTLEKIDDYNNSESKEKRRAIRMILAGITLVGGAYVYLALNSPMPEDYIGTPENPGLGVRLH